MMFQALPNKKYDNSASKADRETFTHRCQSWDSWDIIVFVYQSNKLLTSNQDEYLRKRLTHEWIIYEIIILRIQALIYSVENCRRAICF